MGRIRDLTGCKFDRLLVIEKYGKSKSSGTLWKCQCLCGKITVVLHSHLTSGHTKSCGCLRLEKSKHVTHGLGKPPLYGVWVNMKTRCYNPKTHNYNSYGGRGIKVCDDWKSDFKSFYDWSISHGYDKGLTIDRIDVNGDYSPDNCRWVKPEIQSINKRTNRFLEYEGKRQTLSQWAVEVGILYDTLRNRLIRGWSVEDALTKEVKH